MNAKRLFYPLAILCLTLASCGKDMPETASSGESPSDEPDACMLLTVADIEETMGVTPGEAERANPSLNDCQWPNPDADAPVAYVGLSNHSTSTWEDYREEWIANGMGDPDEEGERVDIGHFGHYHPDVSLIQVFAEGGLLVTLNARGSTKAQILDLANKAHARLD